MRFLFIIYHNICTGAPVDCRATLQNKRSGDWWLDKRNVLWYVYPVTTPDAVDKWLSFNILGSNSETCTLFNLKIGIIRIKIL